MNKNRVIKNTHLLISSAVVLPISLVYGFFPEVFFKLSIDTVDEKNILKAIMGIYIGFALLWILGVFRTKFWKIATVSNFIFMFGLAFGRIISMISDGIPSKLLMLGVFGELVLGIYGVYVYRFFENKKIT
jgi:Domain of unknown function (DUF4345)